MLKTVLDELRHHAPFTALGAAAGILLAALLPALSPGLSHTVFYSFHPLHVVLSALVTTAMYRRHHAARSRIWLAAALGYVASIGLCTLSDSVIPYLGELLLRLPQAHAHVGFLEEWWIVNPAALLGIGIGLAQPNTKAPHSGHVLVSTAASLAHMLMALGTRPGIVVYLGLLVFLFLAVWLPCCLGDIAFPLLFVRPDTDALH
jgi:hypothetical protein